jgi:peroxiredoxin
MKQHMIVLAALTAVLSTGSSDAANIGEAAPAFSVHDTRGQVRTLADFKGKYVVLEWTNPGCPYVQKHYRSGNLQKLQKTWTEKGVVWLTIHTTPAGRQNPEAAEQWNERATREGAAATALLLDPDGRMGRAFGAKTTPHMFVINPEGTLVYQGALDDKRGTDVEEVATARNLVSAALEEALAGKPVSTPQTPPYGCGVKY